MFQARGCGVAIITPLKDNQVDFPALKAIIEHVIKGGVDFIVALGTTGEAALLSETEATQVLEFIIQTVNKRVSVVAGHFGGSSTGKLVQRLQQMKIEGLDGIMCSSPAYVRPTQEGIYQHYMELADHSPVPIIIYNIPSRTAVNIEIDTLVRLASNHPQFMAVKEATGDVNFGLTLLKEKPDHFEVLSGDDPTTMSMCMLGASGGISVIANAFPYVFAEMIKAARTNHYALAKSLNERLMDIHAPLYAEGNPTGIKALLNYLGYCTLETRLPLIQASTDLQQELIEVVHKSGILDLNPKQELF